LHDFLPNRSSSWLNRCKPSGEFVVGDPVFIATCGMLMLLITWRISTSATPMSRVRPIPCRRLIPDTIGHSYTNTDTGLYKFFVLKMRFYAGYRCVQVIYVCGVYAQKYGMGLKLQACTATVLTAEMGKWTTGLLVSARPIPIPTYAGEYPPIPYTGIGLTLPMSRFSICWVLLSESVSLIGWARCVLDRVVSRLMAHILD